MHALTKLFLASTFGLVAIASQPTNVSADTPTQPPPETAPEVAPAAPATPPPSSKEDSSDDENPDAPFYNSVNGPGTGKTQGLVGAGGIVLAGGVGGPGFSLGLVYGIADVADFQLRTDVGIILASGGTGVVGQIDPSFMFRILGKRNMEANFGLKFGPEILYAAAGGGGVAIFGFTPGLATSFGSSKVQASLGMDFPIYFAVAGSLSGTGTTAAIRPTFAVEGNVGGSTNLFLKAGPLISFEGGFALVTILTGVTF